MDARVKPGHDKEEVHENVTMRLQTAGPAGGVSASRSSVRSMPSRRSRKITNIPAAITSAAPISTTGSGTSPKKTKPIAIDHSIEV